MSRNTGNYRGSSGRNGSRSGSRGSSSTYRSSNRPNRQGSSRRDERDGREFDRGYGSTYDWERGQNPERRSRQRAVPVEETPVRRRPEEAPSRRRPEEAPARRRPQDARPQTKKRRPNTKGRRKKKKSLQQTINDWMQLLPFIVAIVILILVVGHKKLGWFAKEPVENEFSTEAAEMTNMPEDGSVPENFQSTVSLMMVGDVLLHDNLETVALRSDNTYDYSSYFSNIKSDIAAADLALISQEIIIGGRDLGVAGYPDFNAPNEMADNLKDAGFNVILHASNHAYDKGELGITNCLSKWNKSYPSVNVLGIHANEEDAKKICYVEQNGIRIAILNYTYGVNGDSLPSEKSYLIDILEENRVRADLQEARANADFVVVCPHWGTEYSLDVDQTQQQWAQLFLEEGVDLVLGSHPHVIEKVEMLENASGHQMLVYYSLGNFVNWTVSTGNGIMNRFVGGMANVTIGKTFTGEVKIADYDVTALICHVTSQTGGVTVFKLADYNEGMASQNEVCALDNSFSYDYAKRLCDRVWGENWK